MLRKAIVDSVDIVYMIGANMSTTAMCRKTGYTDYDELNRYVLSLHAGMYDRATAFTFLCGVSPHAPSGTSPRTPLFDTVKRCQKGSVSCAAMRHSSKIAAAYMAMKVAHFPFLVT